MRYPGLAGANPVKWPWGMKTAKHLQMFENSIADTESAAQAVNRGVTA